MDRSDRGHRARSPFPPASPAILLSLSLRSRLRHVGPGARPGPEFRVPHHRGLSTLTPLACTGSLLHDRKDCLLGFRVPNPAILTRPPGPAGGRAAARARRGAGDRRERLAGRRTRIQVIIMMIVAPGPCPLGQKRQLPPRRALAAASLSLSPSLTRRLPLQCQCRLTRTPSRRDSEA